MLTLFGILLFFDAIYHIVRYFIGTGFVFSPISSPDKQRFLTIVIPVLNEEQNIRHFMKNIANLRYSPNNYRIVFISTEREYISDTRPNTIDIIDSFINKNSRIYIERLHYPKENSSRTDQINLAVSHLSKEPDFDKKYFIFIDADTTIPNDLLIRVNESLDDDTECFQISQNWFKNYNSRSLLMKGFAALQTYKVFSEEIIKISELICPWRGKYFVGNGLIIRGSFFIKVKEFSPFVEDVRMGHLASFMNTSSKSVKNIILSTESAKRFGILLKQTGLWWFGCSLFIRDFFDACKLDSKVSIYNCWFKILTLAFENIRWLCRNIINVIIIIFAIFYDDNFVLYLGILTYLINGPVATMLVIFDKRIVKISNIQKIKAIIGSILIYPIYAIGTIGGVFKFIKYIFTKKINIYRTER
jgi:cellulose synthase/poly-beta-1,6-N-acetylglucosamine synthase-like glycosyltransferase